MLLDLKAYLVQCFDFAHLCTLQPSGRTAQWRFHCAKPCKQVVEFDDLGIDPELQVHLHRFCLQASPAAQHA
jgi:hypothetical protein